MLSSQQAIAWHPGENLLSVTLVFLLLPQLGLSYPSLRDDSLKCFHRQLSGVAVFGSFKPLFQCGFYFFDAWDVGPG